MVKRFVHISGKVDNLCIHIKVYKKLKKNKKTFFLSILEPYSSP